MARLFFLLCLALGIGWSGADASAPDSKLVAAQGNGHMLARPDDSGGFIPGPLFTLGNLTVTGSPAITIEALGLSAYPGRPATSAQLASLASAVRDWLLDHGHPFADASLELKVREEAAQVDVNILLRPGPGYKQGGLRHAGSRTRRDILQRLSLLRYGEDWSETRLRLAVERLARTGYFETLVPGPTYRDADRNLLYPTLALTDLKGNRLGGILGYDSERDDGGLNGYLDIHLINMRGTARDLDFAFEAKSVGEGRDEKEARFAYTEPWILGSSLGGRVDFDILLEDSVYQERNAELTVFQDMGFRSRYSIHFARQDNRDFVADLRTEAVSTGLGLRFDARDRVPATLKGLRLDAKVTGLRRDLGDSSYFLARGEATAGFWANRGRWVAHALVSTGGNWPLRESPDRGELFEIGGANTMRGYREKEFQTDLFGYANLELQFLLAPWSRASIFVVPGLANRPEGDIHWRRAMGYGLGLEAGGRDWTFGASYALNPSRALGDGFVHLRVVNNF